MALGFHLVSRVPGLGTVLKQFIGKPSTQFYAGDALIKTTGYFARSAAQDNKIDGILNGMVIPKANMRPATELLTTASGGEELQYVPCRGNGLVFRTYLSGDDAPLINGTACNSNSNTSQVLVTAAGSSTDSAGGTIFANGEQRTIYSDTVGAGTHTYVVNKPFSRAITTGDVAYVIPFGVGADPKLSASSGHSARGISTAVADKTGGVVYVENVNLDPNAPGGPHVDVRFLQ